MKILIVTEGFFPGKKYGGPPVSIDNFCSLMNTDDCYIVTRDHDLGEKKRYKSIDDGWNDRGNCRVLYLKDKQYKFAYFEMIICEIMPDVIYLQSLFQSCIFSCLLLARKYGIRVLLAPRGELCKGAFRKKYKKYPYIMALRLMGLLKNVYYQSTSEEEIQSISKYLGAIATRIFPLNNIPSIPNESIRDTGNKSSVRKLVFLSRIHPKKNLLYAIKCLRKIDSQLDFDIYGPIEDEHYWELCRKEIQFLPNNIHVNYCGLANHDEVHGIFSQYDAFLFPTLSENYGHVIIEALSVGCAVIVSDRTPWIDLEKNGAGYVCKLEDIDTFERAIQKIINADSIEMRIRAKQYAKDKMNLECLKEEYTNAFRKIRQ